MQSRRLELNCPVCGSTAITYTCEPGCCFNHACGGCGCTFEPVTRATGERVEGVAAPDPPPDCCDPTAACATCGSVAVFLLEDGRIACGACEAVLELEMSEVQPR